MLLFSLPMWHRSVIARQYHVYSTGRYSIGKSRIRKCKIKEKNTLGKEESREREVESDAKLL